MFTGEEVAEADEAWKAMRITLGLPLEGDLDDLDPGEIIREQREPIMFFYPRTKSRPRHHTSFTYVAQHKILIFNSYGPAHRGPLREVFVGIRILLFAKQAPKILPPTHTGFIMDAADEVVVSQNVTTQAQFVTGFLPFLIAFLLPNFSDIAEEILTMAAMEVLAYCLLSAMVLIKRFSISVTRFARTIGKTTAMSFWPLLFTFITPRKYSVFTNVSMTERLHCKLDSRLSSLQPD